AQYCHSSRLIFFLSSPHDPRDLHSFPTRRSSDLLDRVSRLFGSPLTKPAPGAVLPLAVLEPGVRWPAKIGCRRGEREDGVGGGRSEEHTSEPPVTSLSRMPSSA